jgi:hypothetical protein
MMISKKILYSLIGFVFTSLGAVAQSPMGAYYMETIPQVNHINPAIAPRANGFFALPGFNQLFQSDLSFSDVFQDAGSEWISPLSKRFDYDKLYKAAGKSFNLNEQIEIGVFGLGFRSGRDYFSLSMSLKGAVNIGVPSDLFKITETGFADGSSFDLSTLRTKAMAYKEISIGYSREWNDRLDVGINIKPLFGMMGAMSDISRFELSTSREYYDLYVDGNIYVSAPLEVEEGQAGDFPESIEARDMEDEDWTDYASSFKNPGIALDLGAVYKFTDKLHFSAAINNLGYIRWKDDLNSLSFNGTYRFEGLEVDGSNKDDLDEALEAIGDSLKTVIEYGVGKEKFSMPLIPGVYLGAQYYLNNAVSVGFLSRSLIQKHNFRQDFNLSANIQPYSFVALNVNYSYRINGGNGIGSAVSFLLGPMQLYLMADYIPTRYANVIMDGDEFTMFPYQKELSVKLGLNLIFGRHGLRNRPSLDARHK